MVRNPFWRGDPPVIDEIEIYTAIDDTGRAMALEAGAFDFIFPVTPENWDRLADKGFKLWIEEVPIMFSVRVNNVFPPTDDIRVRQAMAHAINYDELIPSVFGKYARRIATPITNDPGAKDFFIYDYDVEKAKALLADTGLSLPLKMKFNINSGKEKQLEAAQVLKAYWGIIGIDVELELMERSTSGAIGREEYKAYHEGGSTDFSWHLSWREWHGDGRAGYTFFSLYHSDVSANSWYIDDPRIDEIAEFGIGLAPIEEKLPRLEEGQKIWMEEAYGLPIATWSYVHASVPEFMDFSMTPNMYPVFENTYFED
jgi:ABC-type transport system substrate-binding protein